MPTSFSRTDADQITCSVAAMSSAFVLLHHEKLSPGQTMGKTIQY